jgi:spore germination protein YaaH
MLRWVYMVGGQLPDSIRRHPNEVDVLSPQWFHLDANGDVYGSDSPDVTRFAKSHGIKVMPAIVNGEFDADAAHAILSDGATQTHALDSLTALVKNFGYDGINIDFENLYAADRQAFSAFMTNVYARLHRENGKTVTMALASKTRDTYGGWSGPFDYAALAPNFDLAVVMTYDDHNSGTEAGPIAPIDWVERVIDYATTSIPPDKLLIGLPLYGYDWNLQTGWARAVSYDVTVRTVFAFGPGIQMDAASQSPTYSYAAGDGTHQIWFENSTSLAPKLALAAKHGLAGWGAWRAGQEDQNFWSLNLSGAGLPRAAVPVPPAPTPASSPSATATAAPAASAPPAPPPAPASIIVAPGDSLSTIAARVGTSVEALIAANHLGPDGFILIGQTLVTPGSGSAPPPAAAPAPPRPAAPRTITVGMGDTLSAISARYGASVQTLLSANGLRSPARIQAGQRLTIPAA